MSKLVRPGQAIEGEKISGHSRSPLDPRVIETQIIDGAKVYRYLARFNVRAWIEQVLKAGDVPRLEPGASTSPDDELLADVVLVLSHDRKPSTTVAPGSATHQANHWHFHKRTAARVTKPHGELAR